MASDVAGDACFPSELRAMAVVGGDPWVDGYIAAAKTLPVLVHLALWDHSARLTGAGAGQPSTLTELVGLALPPDGSITMTDLNNALRITAGAESFAT